MAFTIILSFVTEHDKEEFIARALPKVRGQQVDAPTPEEEADGLQRIGVAVTSQTAARDLCHQIVAFLAHSKTGRVNISWAGTDGKTQFGEVNANAARDAEMLSIRVGAAAKAHLDAEKG